MSLDSFPKGSPLEKPSQFNTETGISHDYANNIGEIDAMMSSLKKSPLRVKEDLKTFTFRKYSIEKPESRYPEAYNEKTRPVIAELDSLTERLNIEIKNEDINIEEIEDICNKMIALIFGTQVRRSAYLDWSGRGKYRSKPKL